MERGVRICIEPIGGQCLKIRLRQMALEARGLEDRQPDFDVLDDGARSDQYTAQECGVLVGRRSVRDFLGSADQHHRLLVATARELSDVRQEERGGS